MGSDFTDATDAAMNRLDALMGGKDYVIVDPRTMQLAFVGLDVDHDQFSDVASAVSENYGAPVIDTLAAALNADANRFQLDVLVGRVLAQALTGAFAMGVLAGELHREQTLNRERGNIQ